MSLRTLLGLCEHKWCQTGRRITRTQTYFGDQQRQNIGEVRECSKCGEVRTFWLGRRKA